MFNFLKKMKGYKITDNNRTRKYGIGANSLKMLKDKAKIRFPKENIVLYLAKDGSEVSDEEYFQTLEPQTLFIVANEDEDILIDSEYEFQVLKNNSPLLQVADLLCSYIENHPEGFKRIICEYEKRKGIKAKVNDIELQRAAFSSKTDHQEWFTGQDERYSTKEEAMTKRAQDRIRGYYYKTKDEIMKCPLYRTNEKAKEKFEKILEIFRYLLIGCDYFSTMFDRSCQRKHPYVVRILNGKTNGDDSDDDDQIDAFGRLPNKRLRQIIKEYTSKKEFLDKWSVSLCSDAGDFYCQGSYSCGYGVCEQNHKINPYSSRENLILFQVWNLDHKIEITRTIIPSLIENVRSLIEGEDNEKNLKCLEHNRKVVDLSVLEYFLEIFSLKNLRLVHIVCHEKVQRSNKSNGRLICEICDEYVIIKELMDISCPEEVDF